MTRWFEVDRAGLRKLLEQRGVAFVLYELVSNAWDAPGTTHVEVSLEPIPGAPRAKLRVVDDAPIAEATRRAAPAGVKRNEGQVFLRTATSILLSGLTPVSDRGKCD